MAGSHHDMPEGPVGAFKHCPSRAVGLLDWEVEHGITAGYNWPGLAVDEAVLVVVGAGAWMALAVSVPCNSSNQARKIAMKPGSAAVLQVVIPTGCLARFRFDILEGRGVRIRCRTRLHHGRVPCWCRARCSASTWVRFGF